ncbi:MAG: hypothetical protein ACRDSF_20905, partial [Pseudonocardiaceae bacterium]
PRKDLQKLLTPGRIVEFGIRGSGKLLYMFDASQDSYQAFREIVKARTNPVVAWVGAGLSRPAGLPTWIQLRDTIADAAERELPHLDEAARRKRMHLLKSARETKKLWLSFEILKKALGQTSYRSLIRRALGSAESGDVPESYRRLWCLGLAGICQRSR